MTFNLYYINEFTSPLFAECQSVILLNSTILCQKEGIGGPVDEGGGRLKMAHTKPIMADTSKLVYHIPNVSTMTKYDG